MDTALRGWLDERTTTNEVKRTIGCAIESRSCSGLDLRLDQMFLDLESRRLGDDLDLLHDHGRLGLVARAGGHGVDRGDDVHALDDLGRQEGG